MKVGILGHALAGRSTFFDALVGPQGTPRAPGKTRIGIARVADPRVEKLTQICQPKKTVYAEITLSVPPNNTTAPLELSIVREMRDLWAYAHVIGAYADPSVEEKTLKEMAELSTEFLLADMERIENRRGRMVKGGTARPGEKETLDKAAVQLESEKPLRLLDWDEQSRGILDELGLLSQRPLITVVNAAESNLNQVVPATVETSARSLGSRLLWLCAPLEMEIAALDLSAQREFLAAYGLDAPVGHRFVQESLALLDQICFFTVGPDEVRAWNIRRGTNARRAARTIHTDLEKGFIRAEVIDYDVFLALGSEAKCKSEGKLRVEGKEYIVQDGDIITVRFNV